MIPVTQSRTGKNGTCFRACVASLLDIKESQVPDWEAANQDPGVNGFLRKRGLRYEEVPVGGTAPVGYHVITGLSPRGGLHAVVGRDGRTVWDPHPQDGTGRGLVREDRYGLLLPVTRTTDAAHELVLWGVPRGSADRLDERVLYTQGKSMADIERVKRQAEKDGWHSFRVQTLNLQEKPDFRRGVKDEGPAKMTAAKGGTNQMPQAQDVVKRITAKQVERLYEKHDDIDWNLERREWMNGGSARSAYASTHNDIVGLLRDAAVLLEQSSSRSKTFWRTKVAVVQKNVNAAEAAARRGDYSAAMTLQEGALMTAHCILDELRMSTRAKDSAEPPPYAPGDPIKLKSGKRTTVKQVVLAEDLFHQPEWHVLTTTGEAVAIPALTPVPMKGRT
jgi:hypothetical protein